MRKSLRDGAKEQDPEYQCALAVFQGNFVCMIVSRISRSIYPKLSDAINQPHFPFFFPSFFLLFKFKGGYRKLNPRSTAT